MRTMFQFIYGENYSNHAFQSGEKELQILCDSLDGRDYFEKVRADNINPAITPYGILYRNGNKYEHIYDGRHFPRYEWQDNIGTLTLTKDVEQEFLYLPFLNQLN